MPEQKRFQKKKLDANDYKTVEKVAKTMKIITAVFGIGVSLVKIAPRALKDVVKNITKV